MVVLTIVAPSNGHTVYFDQPLPKPNYVRLLSCSLYNSFKTLKHQGQIFLTTPDGKEKSRSFPQGNYTVEYMAKELQKVYIYLPKSKICG